MPPHCVFRNYPYTFHSEYLSRRKTDGRLQYLRIYSLHLVYPAATDHRIPTTGNSLLRRPHSDATNKTVPFFSGNVVLVYATTVM